MRILSTFILMLALFVSCSSDDDSFYSPTEQATLDNQVILDYLAENNLDAEKHASGLYYIIHDAGDGERFPTYYDEVEVRYRGTLIDGTVFDETIADATYSNILGSLIYGWQIGLPLIGEGGNMTLFIPSLLGYGSYPLPGIPANSVLIFDIELVSIQ